MFPNRDNPRKKQDRLVFPPKMQLFIFCDITTYIFICESLGNFVLGMDPVRSQVGRFSPPNYASQKKCTNYTSQKKCIIKLMKTKFQPNGHDCGLFSETICEISV